MEDCGFNFEPAKQRIKEYECPICNHLLCQAMELPCSHMTCQSCLWAWQQKPESSIPSQNPEKELYSCPDCKAPYSIEQARKNATADRLLLNTLEVKCIWNGFGCTWVGLIKDYQESHKESCKFCTAKCPYPGCNQVVHRSKFESHEESCDYRYSECRVCNVHVDWKEDGKDHICMVRCPNSGCSEMVDKSKLQEHKERYCRVKMVFCKYRKYGCLEELPIGAMEIHWATCSTTKRDIVKVEESSDIVKDRKREAERLEKKFNEIEPRRNALMQEHGALLKKWEEIEKTMNVVTGFDGNFVLVRFDDLRLLIIEDDFRTFLQYTLTCPDALKMRDEKGDSLLHHAVLSNRPKHALWMMQNDMSALDKNHDGFDLSRIAISVDAVPVLKLVLDYHPEMVNEIDSNMSTLLHWAAEMGHEACVQYLCSRVDIDVNLKNNHQKKADEVEGVTKEIKKIIKHRR